jgi:hypothetical protein
VQLYTIDIAAEAGSRGLALRDERGSITEIGSSAGGLTLTQKPASGVVLTMSTTPSGSNLGTVSNHGMNFLQNNTSAMALATDGNIYLQRPTIIQSLSGLQIGIGQLTLTYTAGDTYLTINPTGGHQYQFIGSGTGSGLGPGAFTLWDVTAGPFTRLAWSAAGDLSLGVSGLAARQVSTGAPDSAAPGFRILRIAN